MKKPRDECRGDIQDFRTWECGEPPFGREEREIKTSLGVLYAGGIGGRGQLIEWLIARPVTLVFILLMFQRDIRVKVWRVTRISG